jgi:YrbI family 3-deoxy-D-manno-octulosonate 8-phosphate phosphatase
MQGGDDLGHIRSKAGKIRALVCDIDGTCTDGFKFYGEDGSLWKRFSSLDIQALKTWNRAGNLSFFITGESGPIAKKFAEQCHIPMEHVFGNAGSQKVKILCKICQQHALTFGEIAYIGDDMNDLGIIEFLIQENGVAACPANAMPLIQEIPHISKLQAAGGQGSVAEWIERLVCHGTPSACL